LAEVATGCDAPTKKTLKNWIKRKKKIVDRENLKNRTKKYVDVVQAR
jgi:hypothetical protein